MKTTMGMAAGALALFLVGIAGCGGSDGPKVVVSGVISDLLTGSELPGVSVCVHGTSNCTTTTSGGAWSLMVPDQSDIVIEQKLADYESKLSGLRIAGKQLTFSSLIGKKSDILVVGTAAGATIDLTKSLFSINVFDASNHGLAGVALSVSGGDGDGPYWQSTTGFSKTGSTTNDVGAAAWINASSGTRTITATKAGLTCTAAGNIPGSGAGTTVVTLEAGYLTAAGFVCQ